MATNNRGKSTVVARATQLIAGANKHLASVTKLTLAGGSYTPAELTTQLQRVVSLRDDVDTAKATAKAKLAVETADMPSLRTLMSAVVTYVKAAYGNAPDVLADFGVHPKTRAPLTAVAKAAAAVKRKATRAARNTMGSTQKKGVKGDVTGITVTPVTAPKPITATPASPTAGSSTPGATAGVTPHTA